MKLIKTYENQTFKRSRILLKFALIGTFVTASLTGCDADSQATMEQVVTTDFRLQQIQSCDDLNDYFATTLTEYIINEYYFERYAYGSGDDFFVNNGAQKVGAIPPAKIDTADFQPGISYTGTNNHEADADEADSVKTDGYHTYILRGDKLQILKTWKPSQLKLLKSIDLRDFERTYAQAYQNPQAVINAFKSAHESLAFLNPSEKAERLRPRHLTLKDDLLVIFADVSRDVVTVKDAVSGNVGGYKGVEEGTRVILYNVKNPSEPKLLQIIDFDGEYRDARTVATGTYMVHSNSLGRKLLNRIFDHHDNAIRDMTAPLRQPAYFEASKAKSSEIRGHVRYALYTYIRQQLDSDVLNDLLPKRWVWSADFTEKIQEKRLTCSDVYLSGFDNKINMLSVTQLPKNAEQSPETTSLIANFSTVYSTATELFLGQDFMQNSGWWGGTDSTAIHKFSFPSAQNTEDSANPRKVSYLASGKVDGLVKDQFSISEHNGFLRLFTTVNFETTSDTTLENDGNDGADSQVSRRFPTPSANLYILKQEGTSLAVASRIEKIVTGEQVMSARFIGDKGYLVTFRRVDPLFSFDLSNPEKPTLIGELKIPGFSSYIHPLGDDHLLTIGRAGTDDGDIRGLQLQVFDVSAEKPRRAAELTLTDSMYDGYSEAENDSHAFTFDPTTGVLSIPVFKYKESGAPDDIFDGFEFFLVKKNSIKKLGNINHMQAFFDLHCNGVDSPPHKLCHGFRRYPGEYRSIIITGNPDLDQLGGGGGDLASFVYTISPFGTFIQNLEHLTDVVNSVPFEH